ncbi:HAMP domain-containing histidine kinase [Aquihabitans sp. G128]|uniref:sensor histidine kinase n=1 Tax=Aquihabitans sp. G128 TaxID=2849779 RepID=UPI001C22A7C4|nr:HAMP domain-containing sensor histidine kinase [Aquihabitans sp. G128]QXC63049.1 HAMP domain-containing histidine kinase [Aquihabitans sp. G128]
MRRRLLLAMLATVALSLVLAGSGTFLLLRAEGVRAGERSLQDQAEGVAALVDVSSRPVRPANQARIIKGLRLEGISVVGIGPRGNVLGQFPAGVTAADLDRDVLGAGGSQGGRHGDLLWAAAGVPGARGTGVVVLTRSADPPRVPVGWFLVAGAIALAVGAGVAWWLSGGLTRPLRRAQQATVRIAAGDLSARLPDPGAAAGEEVADLTRSMNEMVAALEHSRGLEKQFLLSVSHDLRTPLTSIRGYAEAIADGTATDPSAAARTIGTEARRLARLVQDLLDLGRLEARQFSFDLRPLAVAEVVVDVAEGFRPAAEAAGLALVVHEPPMAAIALVDPDRLAQAVANLVENALRYAAGTIVVRADGLPAGGARISVRDDGPGIAVLDLPHVFDRSYAADRTAARPAGASGGSGLGLAVVRELVGAMGGRVSAEAPADGGPGAELVVLLPPPPPGPVVPSSPAVPPAPPASSGDEVSRGR